MASFTTEYSDVWEYLSTNDLKDVTSEDAEIVNQVKELQAQNKYKLAADLIEEYGLKNKIICADYINAIDEKIRNLEIKYISNGQCIYISDDNPETIVLDLQDGDVWIGE